MTQIIKLLVNNDDVSGRMEWSMSCEEILGGIGRATITVQDRDNTWEPQTHWDVKAVIASSGFVLYRGEIITEPVTLDVGFPWTRWVLTCADYNGQIPQRLVGAIDGTQWVDADGLGDFISIDPYANSLATDKLTVQALFAHYFRVAGESAETETYVGEFLTNFATIYWMYSNLQASLEQLASFVTQNLQFWLDPDLFFHWTVIPAWQDLAQVLAVPDDLATLAQMLPQFAGTLALAPKSLASSPVDDTEVPLETLSFTFDGASQPEQAYVKGATGFTYDPGTGGSGTGTLPPITQVQYLATFTGTTTIYDLDAAGHIVLPGTLYGAAGQTAYVQPVLIPDDPARGVGSGGGYWAFVTGPVMGKVFSTANTRVPGQWWKTAWGVPPATATGYITFHGPNLDEFRYFVNAAATSITRRTAFTTDGFSAYITSMAERPFPSNNSQAFIGKLLTGSRKGEWVHAGGTGITKVLKANVTGTNVPANVTVAKVIPPEPPPFVPPSIGIGGSGWANDEPQDPNKRQAYIEAPVSTTKAERDAVGGQTIYRGKFPTLRGNVVVKGTDGWRAGQLIRITDPRLPTALNGKYFIIQRVSTSLIPTQDVREYSIDWGDGPVARQTQQPLPNDPTPPPANQIEIAEFDLSPEPNASQIIEGQLVNASGLPWAIAGKVVNWTFEVYDADGNQILDQGLLDPTTSMTDRDGKARTTLTTGDRVGLVYFVFAESPAI